MKATLPKSNKSYVKAETGNRVWKYSVTGTEAEIKAFEDAQEKVVHNEEDGNKPIMFSTTYYGPAVELGISSKGNIYANTEKMDAIKDVMSQLGEAGAKAVAEQVVGNLFGTPNASATPVSEVEEATTEDISEM